MMRYLFFTFLLSVSYYAMSQQDTIIASVNGVDFVMVRVEGGTFHRGTLAANSLDSIRFRSSMGVHDVNVSTFYISRYEVTQELYYYVTGLKPAHFKPDEYDSTTKEWFRNQDKIKPNHPVECVSWYDVQAFLDSLNKLTGLHFRLPTEAEWEYAARGGVHNAPYPYAGSFNIDNVTFFHYENPKVFNISRTWTEKVGQKQPNALGLYDMTGNVAEWCSDWFSPTYYQTKTFMSNPKGPNKGEKKAVRGGWFMTEFNNEYQMEIRYRRGLKPDAKFSYVGFRIVLDVE